MPEKCVIIIDKAEIMLYYIKASFERVLSGGANIAGWSSSVARRAHNPKVRRFKSPPRNHKILV